MSNPYGILELGKLSTLELRGLNRIVVDLINERIHMEAQQKARQFNIGDIVQFRSSKTGNMVKLRVNRINQKTISGAEITADGRLSSREWRVSPGMLSKV